MEQTFCLIEEVSAKWRKMGRLLGLQENQLDTFELDTGCTDDCWSKVMEYWLNGHGGTEYPNTWDGLYNLLVDIKCSSVASHLRDAVSSL